MPYTTKIPHTLVRRCLFISMLRAVDVTTALAKCYTSLVCRKGIDSINPRSSRRIPTYRGAQSWPQPPSP